jgi:hypothetical protein
MRVNSVLQTDIGMMIRVPRGSRRASPQRVVEFQTALGFRNRNPETHITPGLLSTTPILQAMSPEECWVELSAACLDGGNVS